MTFLDGPLYSDISSGCLAMNGNLDFRIGEVCSSGETA
jgi:hypothetical protein